jgi:hypothetical protein
MMGTEAYLICDANRTAYDLGKFLGTWTLVDWSLTNRATFAKRILDAWIGAGCEYEEEQNDDGPGSARAYAARLADELFVFCVAGGWSARVVHEDFFYDDAELIDAPWARFEATPGLSQYRYCGSRWDL